MLRTKRPTMATNIRKTAGSPIFPPRSFSLGTKPVRRHLDRKKLLIQNIERTQSGFADGLDFGASFYPSWGYLPKAENRRGEQGRACRPSPLVGGRVSHIRAENPRP
jgi:hypothetical protein